MRLAVLSDIHGNSHAFQAVLDDLAAIGGADQHWILGDLVAFGLDPIGCLNLIREMKETKVIRGNTDRELIRGSRPAMPRPTAENWQELAHKIHLRELNFAWTLEKLGWQELEYLLKLETELALEVENYGWVVGVHAVPGDDEMIMLPDTPEAEVLDAWMDREGRLGLGGHTHRPMDRDLGRWRIVNPGSIGLPMDGDPRAAYALITFENDNAHVEIRRVEYDLAALIAALEAEYPAAQEWIIPRLQKAGQP